MPRKTKEATAPVIGLAEIVAATTGEAGFLYVDPNSVKEMVDNELIEVNPDMVEEGTGFVAARATTKGINQMNDTVTTGAAETPAAAPEVSEFEITTVTADVVNKKRTGAGRPDKYPFDKLPAPSKDSNGNDVFPAFFIPATEAQPEPWKSLASTVSTASKRYATQTGTEKVTVKGEEKERAVYEYSRKFKITEGEKDGAKGAWVARIK